MERRVLTLILLLSAFAVSCLAQASRAGYSDVGFLYPFKESELYGYLDSEMKVVIPAVYSQAGDFSEGLAAVKFEGKYGYINRAGEFVIPNGFNGADKFVNGVARVLSGDGYFYINIGGKIVARGDEILEMPQEGLMRDRKDRAWGFLDQHQNVVIPYIYDWVSNFSEGLAVVKKKGLCGYISKTGKIVIPLIYERGEPFHEGLASVFIGGKFGYINKKGEMIIRPDFDWGGKFKDGVANVRIEDMYTLIDNKGKFLNENMFYIVIKPFAEGLAAVLTNEGKWGYITVLGEVKVQPQFSKAEDFIGRFARVYKGVKMHYIDKEGNIVWSER